jgi:hypothetical protein
MSSIADLAHRIKRALDYSPSSLHCSVCNRARTDDLGFISGPGVFFCGNCVKRAAAAIPAASNPEYGPGSRCRCCGGHRPLVTFEVTPEIRVCVVCVRMMNDMIDDYDLRYGTRS